MALLDAPTPKLHDTPAPAPAGPAAVVPSFWTGTPWLSTDRYRIDAGGAVDRTPDGELAQRMRSVFDETGFVLVTNTGVDDVSSMRSLARLVLDGEMAYDGGSNPRRHIAPNVYEVGAPLPASLHYHHEMAYIGRSTEAIAFLGLKVLPAGRGRTFVSDSIAATDALLATPFGRKLARLGLCYHRTLTDRRQFAGRVEYGVYNHWQQSFGSEDPDVAVERAEESGLETEWGPDGLLRTRYRAPAFEYFPALDRNVLFASVADHGVWFDTWPLVQHLSYAQRPLDLTFGDGTAFSHEELSQFVAVYDAFGTPIDWNVGDVAVICNYRFAHGRPGIQLAPGEERELGVLLGAAFDRVGVRRDRW